MVENFAGVKSSPHLAPAVNVESLAPAIDRQHDRSAQTKASVERPSRSDADHPDYHSGWGALPTRRMARNESALQSR